MDSILLPHQLEHFNRVERILKENNSYLDTSEMGTGKTYIALAVAKKYNTSIMVVAPLSLLEMWSKLATQYKVPVVGIINFHTLRTPKTPFLTVDDEGTFKVTQAWKDQVEKGVLLILDEVHNFKNPSRQTSAAHTLVREIAQQNGKSRVAALSATPFDKEIFAENILKVLGIITAEKLSNVSAIDQSKYGLYQVIDFCMTVDRERTLRLVDKDNYYALESRNLCYKLLTEIISKELSSSMSRIDLSRECRKIPVNGYFKLDVNDHQSLQKALEELTAAVQGTKGKDLWSIVTQQLIQIEKSKVNLFVRLAKEKLQASPNSKVVIFVNYTDSGTEIANGLKEYGPLILNGKTRVDRRDQIINDFQEPNNRFRVIVSHPKVGGVGVSLDDRHGNFPRYVFISPSYNFIDIEQATGRVFREKTCSDAHIYIVYVKGSENETHLLVTLGRKSEVTQSMLQNRKKIQFPNSYPAYSE